MKNKFNLFNFFVLFSCYATFSVAQNKAKLSAFTQQYIQHQFLSSSSKTKLPHVIYKKINNAYFLSALIKVSPAVDEVKFKNLDVKVGTKAGLVWTVQIPENKFNDFVLMNGIEYIQLDEPIYSNLDIARITTRVDSVHRGIALPMAYTGKNVVVGILDVGMDYSHPAFYDTLGNKYRIKKVWEQKSSGTPPVGYYYGHELLDSLSMVTAGTDNASQTHGTHVAGISSGSGLGGPTSSKYRGVAYESDLVMVGITPVDTQWTSAGMSDIIDGMNYVYTYAASVGKPAVVNLSWGCTVGPHDGSSLFSQACNVLTGPGKLFVVSAGNNGTNAIHVKKSFTLTDTLLKSVVNFNASLVEKKTWLDIWGDVSKLFQVKLSLHNGAALVSQTRFFTLNNTTLDTFIVGALNDTCFFKITLIPSDYNSKPHALIDVYKKSANNLCLTVKANSGTVHAWTGYVKASTGYYGSFSTAGITGATAGNLDYTIGEMACTNSAITVGAYASKVSYVDVAGSSWSYNSYVNANKIVPFSSHGPTIDNRMKPDITAPGLTIASAVSSYDTAYSATGSSKSNVVRSFINPLNGKTYYYGELSGTSMSSPMAAGIVALMLQVNPLLTPTQVRNIIAQTAIKDAFTTATPNPVLWGAGKINAYQALRQTLYQTGISTLNKTYFSDFILYPNPTKGQLFLKTTERFSGPIKIYVHTVSGMLVYSKDKVMTNEQDELEILLPSLSDGLYLTTIVTPEGSSILKTVIQH
jgi:subtilisin family serine protease